jgi:hypothetical protein
MWQISIVLTTLSGLCVVLAVDLRQTARQLKRLRSDLAAERGASAALAQELADVRKDRDEWAAIATLDHETAVRLACELHGKSVVDKAIDDAHKRGTN